MTMLYADTSKLSDSYEIKISEFNLKNGTVRHIRPSKRNTLKELAQELFYEAIRTKADKIIIDKVGIGTAVYDDFNLLVSNRDNLEFKDNGDLIHYWI